MGDRIEGAPEQALGWHQAGRGAVLATVVETWGSAPRRAGAQMAISGDGEIAGSVSGGCVEGAVAAAAEAALATGRGRLMEFGVSDGDAFAVGLACGGTIRVLVEPVGVVLRPDVLAALVEARAARRAVAYVCDAETGGGTLRFEGFAERFRMDRSGLEADGRFVAIHSPPQRMIVVGAVHIAQALLPMARMAGFDPVVIDPRSAFGNAARFPGERIVDEWPDAALAAEGIDARTAVVTLTHDPKLDDPALQVAIGSEAFYIGALGSTRTHAKRVARLQEAGFAPDEIARISGPVGLDIGAATPGEIAVSVLAEVVAALRGKT